MRPIQKSILKHLNSRKGSVKGKDLRAKLKGIGSYPYFINSINELIAEGYVDWDVDSSHKGRGRKPLVYSSTAKGRAADTAMAKAS